jgi:hypothetical protein
MNVSIEMPKYKCHKEVWALKIKDINTERSINGKSILYFEDSRYAPKTVSNEYIQKHKPQIGGYYVIYENGYESWSPADVFEAGYTKV